MTCKGVCVFVISSHYRRGPKVGGRAGRGQENQRFLARIGFRNIRCVQVLPWRELKKNRKKQPQNGGVFRYIDMGLGTAQTPQTLTCKL